MNGDPQYKIQIIPSLKEISQQDWDRLATSVSLADNNDDQSSKESNAKKKPNENVQLCGRAMPLTELPNPFVSYAFLSSMEDSGSAIRETGWLGQHLLLQDEGDKTVGILPCYLKNHSQGEYVFDHGWADAFERAGGHYYPKLQCSVPFTPATGPRILVGNDQNAELHRSVLASGLKQLCSKLGVSSAHITFVSKDEWQALERQDYLLRVDQQFHWQNQNYDNFQQFLDGLSSRKRKNIRKERKSALAIDGLEIEWIKGQDISEKIWDQFFEFYLDTGSRKWGQPYLTREFYTLVGERMPDQVVLVMAKRKGKYIAGAINFVGDNCLYGRHWGCVEYHPALHFEICYYQAIEFAIAHGLGRVEAGAQGPHKLARGYLPVTTFSVHWIENPGLRNAISDYLDSERKHVKKESEFLSTHGPFKKSENSNGSEPEHKD
ncbi:MAG: N-acetyltransferase [Hyphomicrobiales bacterium]|nr:N-acetyltransferase [Hyphomicrobiales bacterium]